MNTRLTESGIRSGVESTSIAMHSRGALPPEHVAQWLALLVFFPIPTLVGNAHPSTSCESCRSRMMQRLCLLLPRLFQR